MWDRLHKQLAVELEQLRQLIEMHRPLLTKCRSVAPDPIERSALAAMLHSFYTGVENIFKRVAVEIDGALPEGESWHRELLDAMTRPSTGRREVISLPFRDLLREYLHFRHVFRQAYSFQLRWEKMAHLVLATEENLRRLGAELDNFFDFSERSSRKDTGADN